MPVTRRAFATVAAAALMAATPLLGAEETLSKRVIVYLDLSGSMKPAETESPFSTTAEALQLLLDEPGFVSDQDEVLFLFFGDQVAADYRWPFGSPRGTLVPALRKRAVDLRGEGVAQRTNLDEVLANLTGQLGQKRSFNRQVIIVASDFVHEPGRIGPAARKGDNSAFWSRAIDDWQRSWPSASQRLLPLLGDTDRNPFVLIDAPPVGRADGERRVRAEVLKDLETIPGAERLDLGAGGLDAPALAARIRRRLYFPLKVVARTNLTDRSLEVSVENPNGAAVNVERLELTCRSVDGKAAGDPASLSFENTDLARPVAAQSRANAQVALGSQPCLDDAAKVEVRVSTVEGAAGVGEREISWIDPESIVTSAIEGNLLFRGSVLRLVVMLRGEAAPDVSFLITVSKQGPGGSTVAKGLFSPPASLEPFRARPYLFVFQLPEEARERLSGRQLEVRIAAARELRTEPRNDASRSRVNGLQGAVGSVSLLAFVLTAWYGFRQRKQLHGDLGRIFQIQRFYEWILALLLAVLNLVNYIFKPELLEHFRFASSAQPLMVAVGAAVVGFAIVRWRASRSLVEAAQKKAPPPESLFDPQRRDWWKPWVLALLLFSLGFGITWQLAPKGEQGEPIPVTLAEAGG